MDLSETILAAMIGAAATMATAMFQLFLMFRARSKQESKPKRGSGMRSLLLVFAIVLASAVGGFAYSELRAERAREDIRGLRAELSEQFKELAASSAARLDQLRGLTGDSSGLLTFAAARSPLESGVAESIAQVPACNSQPPAFGNQPVACAERDADRLALCAIVPAQSAVQEVQLFARAADSGSAWDGSRIAFDQDAGGVRFTGAPFELAEGSEAKAVCANVEHWNSERAHALRLVVLYSPNLNPTAARTLAAP